MGEAAKSYDTFECVECGQHGIVYMPRCPSCRRDGTFRLVVGFRAKKVSANVAGRAIMDAAARPLRRRRTARDGAPTSTSTPAEPTDTLTRLEKMSPDGDSGERVRTGVVAFDAVLDPDGGSGPRAGSVTLLAGRPGLGKTTLCMQLLAGVVAHGERVALCTAEQAKDEILAYAARLELAGLEGSELVRVSDREMGSYVDALVEPLRRFRPRLLVVDSLHAYTCSRVRRPRGGPTQCRAISEILRSLATEIGAATVVISHVVKDGGIAGPNTIEHDCDAVAYLTAYGDRLKLCCPDKNRGGRRDVSKYFSVLPNGRLVSSDGDLK